MSRRSFLVAMGLVVFLFGGGGGLLFVLLRHEPQWYEEAGQPRDEAAAQLLKEQCQKTGSALISAIGAEDAWEASFTDAQLNYLIEDDFVGKGMKLPDGVYHPRLRFEENKVQLAFRWGTGTWSSVISIDLGIYVPIGEPNALALELEGFHVGALPFTAQSLLERIAEAPVWQQNGVEFTWYRNLDNGHPVAILRLLSNPQRTPIQLNEIHLEKGTLTIRGKAGESARTVAVPKES